MRRVNTIHVLIESIRITIRVGGRSQFRRIRVEFGLELTVNGTI